MMEIIGQSDSDGVVTLLLNRPDQRNALSVELCDAITDAFARIDEQRDIRVVVVRGAGEVFCAGADLAVVAGPEGIDFIRPFERMLESVAGSRVPVIAAIQGAALGGGLQLATACDFRIATQPATIGIPSSRLGIVVNFENVRRLVLLAGIVVASEILMAGRTYSGVEARAAGLVNESVPVEQLDAVVDEWTARIAALAPLSVQGAKKSLHLVADHIGNARLAAPQDVAKMDALVRAAYESADLQEGLAALREKRSSNFRGR